MRQAIFRKQDAFTLIELMIVVGIIGILVAIAAPNFARYQSKARQSEAKIALSAIYGGEKSFYSEYSAYAGSMDAIGYVPEGQKRFYTIGFNAAHTGTIQGFSGSLSQPSYSRVAFPSAWTTCTISLSGSYPTGALNDPQQFTVFASGQIRDGVTGNCDTWTINENKFLSNTVINL